MATYNISTSGTSITIDDTKINYSYPKESFITQTEGDKVELFSIQNRGIRWSLYTSKDTISINGKTSFIDGNDLKETLDNALYSSDVFLYNSIEVLDFQANTAGNEYLVSSFRFQTSSEYKVIEQINLSIQAQSNDKYSYKLVSNPIVDGAELVYNQLEDSNIEFAIGNGGNTNLVTSYDNTLYFGACDHRVPVNVNVNLNIQEQNPLIGLIINPMSNGLDVFAGINIKQNL